MGDLKTPWDNPGMPASDNLSGDIALGRGGDPNITDGQKETANSVSGLPALPHRFTSEATPPEPPSLEDRRPGTIDQK